MATEYEPLPDFLDGLRGQGRFDSQGSITVNKERATRLSARFRFKSPYQYILKLVQAAIALGAGEIDISCRFGVVQMRFPIGLGSFQEWEHFLNQPVGVENLQGEAWSALELALGALGSLNPRPLSITSWDAGREEGFHYSRMGDKQELQRLQPPSRHALSQTKILIKRAFQPYGLQETRPLWSNLREFASRDLLDIHHEIKAHFDSEFSQVWRHCCFAPVPVFLNWLAVNRPLYGLPKAGARLQYSHSRRTLMVVPVACNDIATRCAVVLSPRLGLDVVPTLAEYTGFLEGLTRSRHWYLGDCFPQREPTILAADIRSDGLFLKKSAPLFSAQTLPLAYGKSEVVSAELIVANGPRYGRNKGWLCLVKNGVMVEQIPAPSLGLSGWLIVASAAGLSTDLTGFQVLRDEKFEQLVRHVRALVAELN